MSKKLLGSDYLLILLYLNNKEPIRGAVRLTKMMFLFKEQIATALKQKGLDSDNLPEFISYNFGPFSKDLYDQIEFFSGIKFIKVQDVNELNEISKIDNIVEKEFIDEYFEDDELKTENKYLEYSITDIGTGFVEKELLPNLNADQLDLMRSFKRKITEISIKRLLYYVYTRYPKYTENSLIKDEVLNNGK